MYNDEQLEDIKEVLVHRGFKLVMKELDDIVNAIQGNILSVPLDKDPAKAQLQLYVERMKYEGARATQLALSARLKAFKER